MENRKKRKEISARTRHQHHSIEQCLEEAPWRRPDNATLKNVDAKKTEGQEHDKTVSPSALEKSPKRKKKNSEKVTRFMEMEYHGTWWTGIEHEDFRTKTYNISQHKFMEELDSDTE
eukprot:4198716-Amphidinium_carterae.1